MKAKSRVVKEFEDGEGKNEGDTGIRGWRSQIEGVEGKIEGVEGKIEGVEGKIKAVVGKIEGGEGI